VVTGYFYNTINLSGNLGGPNDLTAAPSGSTTLTSDIFVAKYLGANGAHLWSERFGSRYDDKGVYVAIDPRGNCDGVGGSDCIVMSGTISDWVYFGTTLLKSAGRQSAYIVKLASGGGFTSPQLAYVLTSSAENFAAGVAVDHTSGNIVFSVKYAGTTTCG